MDQARLYDAIRSSWTRSTSADPDEWSSANPARGQCDVTSLVVLEYLGGDLQLAQVSIGGEVVEHHYWNQPSQHGAAVDLTLEQFREGQEISEPELVAGAFVRSNYADARSELRERHDLLRVSVAKHLRVAGPPNPLGA